MSAATPGHDVGAMAPMAVGRGIIAPRARWGPWSPLASGVDGSYRPTSQACGLRRTLVWKNLHSVFRIPTPTKAKMVNNTSIPLTDEQRLALKLAGQRGGLAKAANRAKRRAAHMLKAANEAGIGIPDDIDPASADDSVIPVPASSIDQYPDGESERMLAWGRYFGALRSELEFKTAKGHLMTMEQAFARDDRWNYVVETKAQCVQQLLNKVPGVTSEQRTAFLIAFQEWRQELGAALRAAGEVNKS